MSSVQFEENVYYEQAEKRDYDDDIFVLLSRIVHYEQLCLKCCS